jgi:hypothetical protein
MNEEFNKPLLGVFCASFIMGPSQSWHLELDKVWSLVSQSLRLGGQTHTQIPTVGKGVGSEVCKPSWWGRDGPNSRKRPAVGRK